MEAVLFILLHGFSAHFDNLFIFYFQLYWLQQYAIIILEWAWCLYDYVVPVDNTLLLYLNLGRIEGRTLQYSSKRLMKYVLLQKKKI